MKWARSTLAVAAWAVACPVLAQDPPAFPSSLEGQGLLTWLQRETDIQPERVISVTSQAVTSLVSSLPAGGGQGPRLVIRAEAVSQEAFARTAALSWQVPLSADCKAGRVRLGETIGYDQRNLRGERRQLRVADAEWRTPDAGTALDFAWRTACDPQFRGPFQMKVAEAEAPPASSPAPMAPASAAAPRAPGFVAQVGAAGSDAEAKALLAAMEPALGGRAAWVERAVVGGKTWHRAVVGDFADAGEAARFCAELKAAGRGCFVRPGRQG